MKIETIQDPNIFNHDFKASWLRGISYKDWCEFLSHNYAYSREEAYHIIRDFVGNKQKQTFLEIGFGNGYDFEYCFQYLHEIGNIIYSGWEITEQFVKYARRKFYRQDYCFNIGSFWDLNPATSRHQNKKFNIIYTRHTLEHQHPHYGYNYFANLLRATKELAIVTWFKPPGLEKFTWNDRDGNGQGAYVNTYSRPKLIEYLIENNFDLEILSVQYKKVYNEIWAMKRDENI